jgi:hypothetical protein
VKVIGIDAYTLDRPFSAMVADYRRTGDGRYIWPAHFAGIEKEYCQIEKLASLDQLPWPYGFFVSCLPVKIQGASDGSGAGRSPWCPWGRSSPTQATRFCHRPETLVGTVALKHPRNITMGRAATRVKVADD